MARLVFTCSLIIKNLARQPVASSLTLIGVSLGVAIIVALGAITNGVERSALLTLRAADADFVVVQRVSGGLVLSLLTEEDAARIESLPGVDFAAPVVVFVSRVERDPYFRLVGIEQDKLPGIGLPVVEGRPLAPGNEGEIYLGDEAAGRLGVRPGGTVVVGGTAFTVSGVFRTDNRWLDGAGFTAMRQAQAIAARPGLVTLVYVRAAPPGTGPDLAGNIRKEFPHLTTVSNLREFSEIDQGLRVLNAMNLAVTVLAAAGAALGVMNTLARSVFERTHEIGILRALGWRRRRVFAMVTGEALVLCLLGAVIGSFAAIASTHLLERASASIASLVGPSYSPDLFTRGATMAVVVSLAGATYPAYRAMRLQPIDAIRSE